MDAAQRTLIFVPRAQRRRTTLVDMARGNRAGLARVNRNGDPRCGRPPRALVDYACGGTIARFASLRQAGVRFVATEKGFPQLEIARGLFRTSSCMRSWSRTHPSLRILLFLEMAPEGPVCAVATKK